MLLTSSNILLLPVVFTYLLVHLQQVNVCAVMSLLMADMQARALVNNITFDLVCYT